MSHWYDWEGNLVAEVPNVSKGGFRPTTIRDARQRGLLPSVTTILQLLNKPLVNDWRVKQAIAACMEAPGYGDEWSKQRWNQVEEISLRAASLGTEIHAGISAGLGGEVWLTTQLVAKMVVDLFWPWYGMSGLVCEHSEKRFVNPIYGYASTIDFLGTFNGEPVIADFKTQDFETLKEANFYDEHALQLAGYDLGVGGEKRKRLSVIISRSKPGLVATHFWDDADRWDNAWLSLLAFWKHLKQYDASDSRIVQFRERETV